MADSGYNQTLHHGGPNGNRRPSTVSPPSPAVKRYSTLFELEYAESTVQRSGALYRSLWAEAKGMTEYRRMLATRERCADFEAKLTRSARFINGRLAPPLPDAVVVKLVARLAGRIATWEHSPIRQRERQAKAAAARRRRNRGRDLQIVRLYESGESQRAIAAQFGVSRGAVRKVLDRDARKADEGAAPVSSVAG